MPKTSRFAPWLVVVFVGFSIVTSACATQTRAAATSNRLRDVLRREYVHGLPFDVARSLGRDAVPGLLEIVRDSRDDAERENAIMLLGMIGDARAREPLLTFFRETSGEVDAPRFRALLKVPVALGFLGAQGDERAVDELIALSSPSFVDDQLSWTHLQYAGTTRDVLIARIAVSGLGLTGHDKALTRLRALTEGAETAEVRALLREIVDESIERNLAVRAQGLERTLSPKE